MRSLGLSLLRGTLLSLLPILLLCLLSARRELPAEASRIAPVGGRQHKAVCYPAESSVSRAPKPRVSVLVNGTVQEFDLRDYLIGVVGAEMPASFSPEALKAQAVAARTEVYYCARVARPHGDAACCTSAACCMAWLSDAALEVRWGDEAAHWREQVAAAVDATAGEVLLWEGEPIFAAFHAASDGLTENCWRLLNYTVCNGKHENDGRIYYLMENSLKGLMLAAGVVITCVIIGLGFYMLREAQSTAKAAGDEMGQLRYRLEEAEYGQYDGLEIIGADLTNLIKKELGNIYSGDVPDVKITVSGGKGTYTYRDNTYLATLQDSTSEKYIEPLSVFTGKVIRDSNRAVTEIIFNVKRR